MPLMQVKTNGAWVEIPALTGPRGAKGDKGDPGAAGKGLTDEQIDMLEDVLNLVTFSDSAAGKTAVNNLLASLRGTTVEPEESYTNLVPTSIDATGAVFNGTGYQDGARINSSGAVSTSNANATTSTGFIKVSGGDVVRVSGGSFIYANNANAIGVYDASFAHLGTATGGGSAYGIFGDAYSAYKFSSVVEEATGVYKWVVPPTESGVSYIRLSCYENVSNTPPGANLIVTVNQEIT